MIRFLTLLSLLMAGPVMAEVKQGPPNANFKPAFKNQTRAPEIRDGTRLSAQTIASGLEHPWGIAVLPDGGYLVTERVGRLNYVAPNGRVNRISGAPKVWANGQGGMLDVAIADDFAASRRIFLTYSKPAGGKSASTAAATAILDSSNRKLSGLKDIFVQKRTTKRVNHFGSRILIDGNIAFITTGDRRTEDQVQNLGSSIGKVLRIFINGSIPKGNPFVGKTGALPEVYAYGLRNPQGGDIHPKTGELWTLEHGPQGGDEINRIQPGHNYGWPNVSYGENYNETPVGTGRSSASGVTEPIYYWDPVIAPGGFSFYDGGLISGWNGDIVAGALRGGIVRLKLNGNRVTGEARYLKRLGRVRDVDVDRDGALLLLIDAPDGELVRVTPG